MFDERALIQRLEAASVGGLVDIFLDHDEKARAALRAYFGTSLHKRLSALAHHAIPQYEHGRRGEENVVFIPDFFGSALSSQSDDKPEPLWMSPAKLIDGAFGRLRLADDGITGTNARERIRASGVLKIHYSEILLTLAQHFNVLAFAYDWRKHPRLAATDLEAALTSWLGDGRDFHLVTHGAGALVARAFLQQFGKQRQAGAGDPKKSRIVMLGPPNHGALWATGLLTGTADVLRTLAALDLRHTPAEIADITRTFLGAYMLLPAPRGGDAGKTNLYDPASYGDIGVPSHHLDAAKGFSESLREVEHAAQMVIVLGSGQPTPIRVADGDVLKSASADEPEATTAAYMYSDDGDGMVSIASGHLAGARSFTVEEQHGRLPSNPDVLGALQTLLTGNLQRGKEVHGLHPLSPSRPQMKEYAAKDGAPAARAFTSKVDHLEKQANALRRRDIEATPETCITLEEQEILRHALPGVLAPRAAPDATARSDESDENPSPPIEPPSLRVFVVEGNIAAEHPSAKASEGFEPRYEIDAIAVGHYRDTPLGSVLSALDEAISGLPEHEKGTGERGILAKLLSRGIAGQEVGQILCLPDPRKGHASRLLLVAGMGSIGKFGGPEATRLAREVCFTAALLHKKNLAMVLIGRGEGNLSTREAVSRILRGVKDAKWVHPTGVLEEITFVEKKPARIEEIWEALQDEKRALGESGRLRLVLPNHRATQPSPGSTSHHKSKETRDTATRITILRTGDTYTFSALTKDASIPEREMRADPALVEEANDGLVHATTLKEQREWGNLLGKLLLPASFRSDIFSGPSVVFVVDATTARIHWEMLADPDFRDARGQSDDEKAAKGAKPRRETDPNVFLGIGRGLSRQLQTSFAKTPNPLVPKQRVLRVLVVADPAPDAPLSGAREEGAAVAALFEHHNKLHAAEDLANRIEVVRLFGAEATRSSVLRALMSHTFDVLHFAGHCGRDGDEDEYGWVFRRDPLQRITRQELSALDRVPSFVFSNACESGITPGRADRRSADMAPSFAESFFAGGVSNLVCTAWPIEDRAACTFALVFYATLLGLEPPNNALDIAGYGHHQRSPPGTIQDAIRQARERIARAPGCGDRDAEDFEEDARTWGAYQHYGNPSFRLLHGE